MVCAHPSGPSRRQVLTWAGAGAAALTLAACSGEEDAPPPEPGERLVSLDEVPVGESVSVRTSEGAEVVVTRVSEEEVVALSAVCTHQGCTVVREAEDLSCPCHGSRFAVADGAVLQGPAEEPLPRVEVRVESGAVVTV
ncbi:Rieske Fe-S protein [Georgenia satyanarayanai]|uniref:Cytochrome bc1 complex Rieske iron-sulfur subunit n=1 Tax=Georgenia satyanarayanai TaxID=860221 RepID=A0A2Y9BX17_9MICO|nr:Rieske (2Fe-2S) protein [Georgenia satyanarayanai]PYG00653.1 Rieske Fe-S protein [Georgenia satyanarayanai]SSA40042.1 Rieske Fe-S protein [Georgenia satyanarayanai]